MAGNEWMIHGANGYTGGLMVEHAVSRGLRPVVAGRNEAAIRVLAERHGLAHRVFSLDDTAAAVRGLDGVGTLLLAAGIAWPCPCTARFRARCGSASPFAWS